MFVCRVYTSVFESFEAFHRVFEPFWRTLTSSLRTSSYEARTPALTKGRRGVGASPSRSIGASRNRHFLAAVRPNIVNDLLSMQLINYTYSGSSL